MNKGSDEMMMIGIDVSKAKLDCFWLKDPATGKGRSKGFANTPAGHRALLNWALAQTGAPASALHFVMEATGVYHEALALALVEQHARVSVVNPSQSRHYADSLGRRSKTDAQDSQVLARYGATHPLRAWQPEALEIRQLKALIARLQAIETDIRRERNRLEKARISPPMDEIIRSIEHVLEHLEVERQRVMDLINRHIDRHPGLKHDQALLETIPGVGPVISRLMLALLHSRHFDTAAQCAAFVGLVPIEHQSGSSIHRRARLSKTGSARIRAKLYMAAVVAIHHNPDIRAQYQRLRRNGKTKMSALGAAMRKLVQICFGVLKHQAPYQPQTVLSTA